MNRNHFLRASFLALTVLMGNSFSSMASHLRAGEITVERESCSSLTFRITVTVFTNTIDTPVRFGGIEDWLDFGDGERFLIPEQDNVLRPDLGEGIAMASFTIRHTYSGNGMYVVSYSEPNRNGGVVNMDDSFYTRFYIESRIIADPFLGCNSTPRLRVPPIDRGCTGVAWFHNPGAYDPDGDSLSYELAVPFSALNRTVLNYRDPAAQGFYTNYANGNETGTGPPSFAINPVDGTLTWDSPGSIGEYNIAFVVREWRRVNGTWVSLGFVRRDMQIIVDDCDNERPSLEVPEDLCVVAGTTIDASIFGTDPDGDSVKIEAFSEVFDFAEAQSPATFKPFPPRFGLPPTELKFQWNTECAHIRDQRYQVVFKITDKSPTGSRLVTFKTWFIRVVGPAPEWESATTDLATRSAVLQWDPYICENAESIQVWRRVDSYAFEPDSCQTGMPASPGYVLIDTVPGTETTYMDTNGGNGLASGAQYCYRLVALFPFPRGGESYVSEEICVDPILADKAIITNVTVDRTDDDDGRITVRWSAPFEADPVQFPPPYTYQVVRAEGFSADENFVVVASTADTTYTDTGLDTENQVYNYHIVSVDANGAMLDPSATASSVRLEATSRLNSIQLSWSATVPWSNQIQTSPNHHLIYRIPNGVTEPDRVSEDELVLLGSVDVTASGFTFLDEGPLEENLTYCYKVMTRGAYGNPKIDEPLENYSQIICTQPGDDHAPCTPPTPVPDGPLDCISYTASLQTCNSNLFSNTLRWASPGDACRNDVSYYKIWVAASSGAAFTELPIQVRDTVYVDENLPSFARCYRIQAVDRSGNRSELSEPVCFDNCPYYELPNIFTPNDDGCNDFFSAYSSRNLSGEDAGGLCAVVPPESQSKCARFVEKVFLRVYNRWGKEVYSYVSGGERTIYIDWDGRSDEGREVSTGVYYYIADVTFDSVYPQKQQQIIKGWVHVMR